MTSKPTKQRRKAAIVVRTMKISELLPHPRNPRKHPAPGSPKWEALKKSLSEDYFDPIVWNKRNGFLVSGHLRTKVLRDDGFQTADVVVKDYTEATHIARMIAANKSIGQDDTEALEDLMKELDKAKIDPGLAGMTDSEARRLLGKVDTDEDETPDVKDLKAQFGFQTSMKRDSRPIEFWTGLGLLEGKVLDFGAGKEKHSFAKYDPNTHPTPTVLSENYDVIMTNFVLQVQPLDHLITQIVALLSRMAPTVLIAVRNDLKVGLHKSPRGYQNIKTIGDWKALLDPFFGSVQEWDKGDWFAFMGRRAN